MDEQTLAQATAVASVAARAAADVLLASVSASPPTGPTFSNPAAEMRRKAEAAAFTLLTSCELGFEVFGFESGGSGVADSRGVDGLELPLAPCWIIDVPFESEGRTRYCKSEAVVSIALVIKGVPAVGVVYDAAEDELFTGRVGGAAFLNRKPIRPAKATTIEGGVVLTSMRYCIKAVHHQQQQREDYGEHAAQTVKNVIMTGVSDIAFVHPPSKAFAMLAAGRAAAYVVFG